MKITGVEKAVETYKRANGGGYYSSSHGVLMINRSTGHVWCDEFADENSWVEYNDSAVIRILIYDRKIDEQSVTEEAERMCAEYNA